MRLFAFILFSIYLPSWAQNFTAKVNKVAVSTNEQFTLTYSVDEKGNAFQGPDLSDFMLYSGPNTSVSYSNINGRASTSRTYSYVLAAQREGQFTIPPARIKINGKVYESNSVTLNVTKQAPRQQQQRTGNQSNGGQEVTDDVEDQINAAIFLKLFIDKSKAYVGEQIVATYKLYYNINFREQGFSPPDFPGFYVQDIDLDPNSTMTIENINGKNYRVLTVKKSVLTPQRSGDLEIPSMEIPMMVQVQENRPPRNIQEQFWGVPAKNVKVDIKSNKQTIHVSSLPTVGQPSDFDGAVGKFSLKLIADRTALNMNDAVNLTLTLEGKGNIDLVKAPDLIFPSDFETYDPKVKDNIAVTASGTAGKKSFEYVLIPRFAGEFDIDAIHYSYFDPAEGVYKKLETSPIHLTITKADGEASAQSNAYVAPKKSEVELVGKDVRYIKTSSSSFGEVEDDHFFGSLAFMATSALPIAGLGASILIFGAARRRKEDEKGTRSRQAKRQATRRLKSAQKKIQGEDKAFFEEIFKALYGYLSDKFSIPVADLTRESVVSALKSRNAEEALINELGKVLDECELARFAPGIVRSKDEMMKASREIIERIENEA